MRKFIHIHILILSLLLTVSAVAKDLTFGAEFTFTNPALKAAAASVEGTHIVNIDETEDARDAFKDAVLRRCVDCRVIVAKNDYEVTVYKIVYPDGWYFVIATDPAVVEVQTKPSTASEIHKLKDRIQKDIFDTARSVGIVPDVSAGGGHIHFDYVTSTQQKLFVLRNLVVDFANHPETSQGIWSFDFHNAAPIASLPEKQRQAFEKLISDVDRELVTTIEQFVRRLHKEVYNHHFYGWGPEQKYQALNLTRVLNKDFDIDSQTLEVRSFRPQKDAGEFLMLVEILQGRIELNKARTQPLKLDMPRVGLYQKGGSVGFMKHINYIAEAGVEPKEYISKYGKSLPYLGSFDYFVSRANKVTLFCSRLFVN